jgi:hypothetical protein
MAWRRGGKDRRKKLSGLGSFMAKIIPLTKIHILHPIHQPELKV